MVSGVLTLALHPHVGLKPRAFAQSLAHSPSFLYLSTRSETDVTDFLAEAFSHPWLESAYGKFWRSIAGVGVTVRFNNAALVVWEGHATSYHLNNSTEISYVWETVNFSRSTGLSSSFSRLIGLRKYNQL